MPEMRGKGTMQEKMSRGLKSGLDTWNTKMES